MQPNPHLQPLARYVGEWATRGSHPMMPGRDLRGHTTFAWLESGAFLLARTRIDAPEVPQGVMVFGTNDAKPDGGTILYFDARGVSRELHWTLAGNVWTWSRDDPGFAQRMTLTLSDDGRTIELRGEMARDGKPWEADLSLTCTRQ